MTLKGTIHERMVVKQEKFGDRKPVVRQDRIPIYDGENCYIFINSQKYIVLNYSVFGVAVESDCPFEDIYDLSNIQFFFESFQIGVFRLRFVRQHLMKNNKYYVAFTIIGDSIKTQVIDILRKTSKFIRSHNEQIALEEEIPREFRNRVYEVRGWLLSLKQQVDSLEKQIDKSDRAQLELVEITVTKVVSDHLNRIFSPLFTDTVLSFQDLDEKAIRRCIKFFHSKMRDIIYQDPFTSRSFYKPLGYAGDYEMMNLIYRNEPAGDTLFAKCLHFYWVQKPAAQAVRNRAIFLSNHICKTFANTSEEETIKFLSVASGPAFEVQKIISEVKKYNHRKAEFHLLDQDLNALKYAQRQIFELTSMIDCKFNFLFHNLAIKNVITDGLHHESCDLIYSAGLFDYFTDPIAKMAGECLFKAVKPGGALIIGNFDYRNKAALEMKIALDWDLIHRSEKDLVDLFGHLSSDIYVESEDQHINLFCIIRKDKIAQ